MSSNTLQSYILQQKLDGDLTARRQFLLNPAISGYTENQLSSALNVAFAGGSNLLSGIGGVGLQNMGLYGVGGANDLNILGSGDGLFEKGLALGGSNSLAAQLQQKAETAYMNENQGKLLQILQAQQQLQQTIALKQSLGIPVTMQDVTQLQQLSAVTGQIQQGGMMGGFGNSAFTGGLPGIGFTGNSIAPTDMSAILGSSGFGGTPVGVYPVAQQPIYSPMAFQQPAQQFVPASYYQQSAQFLQAQQQLQQTIALKQSLGIPVTMQDVTQLQQLSAVTGQIQQGGMIGGFGNSAFTGGLPGIGNNVAYPVAQQPIYSPMAFQQPVQQFVPASYYQQPAQYQPAFGQPIWGQPFVLNS